MNEGFGLLMIGGLLGDGGVRRTFVIDARPGGPAEKVGLRCGKRLLFTLLPSPNTPTASSSSPHPPLLRLAMLLHYHYSGLLFLVHLQFSSSYFLWK